MYRGSPQANVHTSFPESLENLCRGERLLSLDQSVAAVHECHVRPECRPRLGHLDSDDAAAENREPRRYLRRGRRLDVRPRTGVPEPRDVRNESRRAGSHDHGLSRHQLLVADDDATFPVESATSTDERDSARLEPRHLPGVVEAGDHVVAPFEHGGDIDRPDLQAGDARNLTCELDRAQESLRRHARIERALTPDEPVFDDRHREAVLTEPARCHLSCHPGADHHHVELAHAALPVECRNSVRRAVTALLSA